MEVVASNHSERKEDADGNNEENEGDDTKVTSATSGKHERDADEIDHEGKQNAISSRRSASRDQCKEKGKDIHEEEQRSDSNKENDEPHEMCRFRIHLGAVRLNVLLFVDSAIGDAISQSVARQESHVLLRGERNEIRLVVGHVAPDVEKMLDDELQKDGREGKVDDICRSNLFDAQEDGDDQNKKNDGSVSPEELQARNLDDDLESLLNAHNDPLSKDERSHSGEGEGPNAKLCIAPSEHASEIIREGHGSKSNNEHENERKEVEEEAKSENAQRRSGRELESVFPANKAMNDHSNESNEEYGSNRDVDSQ